MRTQQIPLLTQKKTILSPEQKKAKNFYESALLPSIVVAFLLFAVLWAAVFFLLNKLHIYEGFINPGGFAGITSLMAHLWVLKKVRRMGLSLKSNRLELIPKTAVEFGGAPVRWRTLGTQSGVIFNALTPFLLSVTGFGLWCFGEDFLVRGLGALFMPFFLLYGVIGLAFIREPYVAIDEEGIVGSQGPIWRRSVPWKDVSRCELVWLTNDLGQPASRSLIFKDGNEKVRLHLTCSTPKAAGKFEEIATEVKRRLTRSEVNLSGI